LIKSRSPARTTGKSSTIKTSIGKLHIIKQIKQKSKNFALLVRKAQSEFAFHHFFKKIHRLSTNATEKKKAAQKNLPDAAFLRISCELGKRRLLSV